MEYKVLDKGFLRLVDILGDDYSAVKAARVSYGKGIKTPDKDKKLIFYLMEHKHETPFEHIVFTFHVKTPIFVARQWFRHRIGSFNEASLRYTELKDEFYIPNHIRKNVKEDKQKAVKVEDEDLKNMALELINKAIEDSYRAYKELLKIGVAREMARIVLPMSSYTQFYWTVNARSLMNFLNLRADSHAQFEIQQYAIKIAEIFKEKCPWTFEAFLKFNYRGDILKGVEL
ncbi:thymidylate synthase [Thermosipho affectus]|uniref:Flavin-dependent thymidylate synthase n=1 Tax=Thermosipho affectus TaxID=660294 RepID=A0ABX3ILE5_9BACT|nr:MULTISPECIES: FAD-dependent thymidylate synthase [Thermosipho]ANQ53131.1 thymidylate synthase [Thermosipho sp. 1070]APT71580.1 thymidylate synthase [Thermosipho sp. 1063]ONN27999.1 thymidylate synthase [Thermosipho affectus]OOC45656.1 thymidylate synthase [Thermosipho sp. 1074]